MKGDPYKVALEIMKAVAKAYGVTLEDLRSHSRVARLVFKNQKLAEYAGRQFTELYADFVFSQKM